MGEHPVRKRKRMRDERRQKKAKKDSIKSGSSKSTKNK